MKIETAMKIVVGIGDVVSILISVLTAIGTVGAVALLILLLKCVAQALL